MLLEQVPEVFQVFLLQYLTRFILEETRAGLLSNFEVQTAFISWLLEEKARYRLKRWIARLFKILFLF